MPFQTNDDDVAFTYVQKSATNRAYLGGIIYYDLSMYLTPRTVLPFIIDTIVPNNTLSVCRLAIKSRGQHVPCSRDDVAPQYLSYDNDTYHDRAVLDMMNVINWGKMH